MKKYIGEATLLLTAIIWGADFVAADITLKFMNPFQSMLLRFLLATIVLFLMCIKKLKKINKKTLITGTIIGVLLFAGLALQTVGLKYTTVSSSAFLTSTNVVMVPIIGLLLKKSIDRYGVIGVILTLVGVGMLTLQDGLSINLGNILTIISAVFFAVQILVVDMLTKDEDAMLLTFIEMGVCFILSVVLVLFNGGLIFNPTLEGFSAAVYLGIFGTGLSFLLQVVGQKYTSETKAAIIMSTECVFGTIFAIIVLGQTLTLRVILACIIIFIAIIISETKLSFLKPKR